MSGRASAIGPNLMRVLAIPKITGKTYLCPLIYNDSGSKIEAYIYNDGTYASTPATAATLTSVTYAGTWPEYLPRTASLIRSDSGGYVADNAITFLTKQTTHATRRIIHVFDVYGTGTVHSYNPSEQLTAAQYSDGWLWFFSINSGTVTFKKMRCDCTDVQVVATLVSGATVWGGTTGDLADGAMFLTASDAQIVRGSAGADDVAYFDFAGSADQGASRTTGWAAEKAADTSIGVPIVGGAAYIHVADDNVYRMPVGPASPAVDITPTSFKSGAGNLSPGDGTVIRGSITANSAGTEVAVLHSGYVASRDALLRWEIGRDYAGIGASYMNHAVDLGPRSVRPYAMLALD